MEQALRETLRSMSETMLQLQAQLDTQQEALYSMMRDIDRLYDIAAGDVETIEQDDGGGSRQSETMVDDVNRWTVVGRKKRNRFNRGKPSVGYVDRVERECVHRKDESRWQSPPRPSVAMSGSTRVGRGGDRSLVIRGE